jgi:periplasmic protein TonB
MKATKKIALVMAPFLFLLLADMFCAFAADEPAAFTVPATPQPVVKTPLKLDPAHPPRIGDVYYPTDSKRLGEQGRCLVKVPVQADGSTRDVSLAQSSGYPRLDEACLRALFPGKFIPATENGKPVERTVTIPIVWSLH